MDRVAYPLLTALLAVGCAGSPSQPTSAPDSGIDGRTMVDAGCPPARDATPCPDKPLSARVSVTRAGSQTVIATVTSDQEGRFRVDLPPGDYTIHPANLTGSVLPAAQPANVSVTEHRYTTITVPFDSGVRGG